MFYFDFINYPINHSQKSIFTGYLNLTYFTQYNINFTYSKYVSFDTSKKFLFL